MKLSDKKRINILDAAEQLFFEHGVQHTTMDQVATQAKASKRTVYNHFASKDVLFDAILSRMFEELEEGEELVFAQHMTIERQLTAIANQEVVLLTSDRFLRIAKIAFMQMLQQPTLAKSIASNQFGCMRYLHEFLQQACVAGELHIEDIDFAAKQFVYQLKSFIFYPVLYGFETSISIQTSQIIEQTVRTFLARYRPI
ncbi:TetR/AcrR family transcriptional regulator [Paraglaciecola polaris]|uniref:TetR family transcriptional regulator n=1 Tax=Paraglaciecola polaris LMG 21857 TaxID=1129793 RepID=K7AF39_9ALTE|nr:TetR/AcrR family transcriptional regulator [Paraglaciecola polaris]GAC33915.1 TetR family transcriptional regulator [Paraglaciecola polaris LMG 21857]